MMSSVGKQSKNEFKRQQRELNKNGVMYVRINKGCCITTRKRACPDMKKRH